MRFEVKFFLLLALLSLVLGIVAFVDGKTFAVLGYIAAIIVCFGLAIRSRSIPVIFSVFATIFAAVNVFATHDAFDIEANLAMDEAMYFLLDQRSNLGQCSYRHPAVSELRKEGLPVCATGALEEFKDAARGLQEVTYLPVEAGIIVDSVRLIKGYEKPLNACFVIVNKIDQYCDVQEKFKPDSREIIFQEKYQ
jgi:hypothetical protein